MIKPKPDELAYVYQKSDNYTKANREYRQIMAERPDDIATEKKLIDNLYLLRDPMYIDASAHYYKKVKDYEVLRRIIDGYKANDQHKEAIPWLETAYIDFSKLDDLKEIISLASFTSQLDIQIKYLRKLYKITDDHTMLFTLFSLNDTKYALERLVILAKEGKLTQEEYLKTIEYLIFDKQLKTAYTLYEAKDFAYLNIQAKEDTYIYLLETQQDFQGIQDLYKYLYDTTKKDIYYTKYTESLIFEGQIEEFLKLAKARYKSRKDSATLDKLIQYNFLNDELEEYLKYLGEKTIANKDVKTAESIIASYIDLNSIEKLQAFLKEINAISDEFDAFKALSIQTLVYLELYAEAEEILLQYPPEDLTASVVYAVFQRKINEKSLPYFMHVLKRSKDQVTKSKLFRYRYKTLRLFTDETYAYFGRPTTFNKLFQYIEHFPKKDQDKNLIKFANASNDAIFISDIGKHFLLNNDFKTAKRLFQKSLTQSSDDLVALKSMGILNTWENNPEEAIDYFNQYTQFIKNDAEINYYLAEIYYGQKKKTLYTQQYQLVLEKLAPDTLAHELMILRAQARLDDPMNFQDELTAIIEKSEYDQHVIC